MAKLTWQKNGQSQKAATLAREHKHRKLLKIAFLTSITINIALLAYVIIIN